MRLLTCKWVDFANKSITLQYAIANAIAFDAAALLAFIQDLRDATNAELDPTSVTLAYDVDVSSLTNGAAVGSGPGERVDNQAVIQMQRSDDGGLMRFTIPAPLDSVFQTTGAYTGQDVNLASAVVAAIIATGETAGVLSTPGDGTVEILKGWNKGQKHS